MRVAIHNYRADFAEAFRTYVERRLRFALKRFGGRVGRVTVRISANSPTENSCRISTEILPFGRIAVEETDSDLFAAIDRATGRIGWLFGRKLERVREAGVGRESIRLAA
ncbi:MAG: HPF/RaiA family ribosome-associated protein [Terracidiphilus sp.]